MRKTRPKRPSADVTRRKILQTAGQIFMQHGFAGTSMGRVAEKAKINQTLIFHHFDNKKRLWREVKLAIVESVRAVSINLEPKNVPQFLAEVIEQRMAIYAKCPKLKRLINWQKLESTHSKQSLIGTANSPFSPLKWKQPIKFLQKHKLLNPKLKPEFLIIWLLASIDGMLDDDLGFFKNNAKNRKHYIKMLVDTLSCGLVG